MESGIQQGARGWRSLRKPRRYDRPSRRLLGFRGLLWRRAEHVGAQQVAGYAATSTHLDLDGSLGTNARSAALPLRNKRLGSRRTHTCQQCGKSRLRQPLFFTVGVDIHALKIRPPYSHVNRDAAGIASPLTLALLL